MLYTIALISGLLLSTLLSILILTSLARNPRIWLKRAPQAIKEAIPPLSAEENRQLKLWGLPLFGLMFLMPLATAFWYEQSYQPMNYGEAFIFLWLMWMVFNLVDLLIIDWLVVVWWQPAWSIVPEVKHLMYHVGYAYHFKAFLKGVVLISVLSLIFAGIVLLI